jgi:hypothetical protein
MSLIPNPKNVKETDLVSVSNAAIQADKVLIQAALLWLSKHPQLTPLFFTIGKYAANHTLTSCFSKGTCQNCNRCLHFLGLDIDHVGVMDLCESAMMSAYAEAIHHPLYSMEMASKGIELIRHAISDLASMPEIATAYHKDLAEYLFPMAWGPPSPPKMTEILNKGQSIYDKDKSKKASAWLYVGLPEVFAKFKNETTKTKEVLQGIINEVYVKWRGWGLDNHHSV